MQGNAATRPTLASATLGKVSRIPRRGRGEAARAAWTRRLGRPINSGSEQPKRFRRICVVRMVVWPPCFLPLPLPFLCRPCLCTSTCALLELERVGSGIRLLAPGLEVAPSSVSVRACGCAALSLLICACRYCLFYMY
eukprot:scaffold12998_cov113-Isochrysis_galbana.AAC.1